MAPTEPNAASLRCPSCGSAVQPPAGWAPRCDSCLTLWRSPLLGALLSAGFPGLGHLYLRRRTLGILEMLGGLGILGVALVHMVRVFLDVLDGGRAPLDLLRVCLVWAPALIGYSLLDGALTWILSRHRIVPKDEG